VAQVILVLCPGVKERVVGRSLRLRNRAVETKVNLRDPFLRVDRNNISRGKIKLCSVMGPCNFLVS
jgi:hypothetical protein